jgi:hypothetical protein
MSSLARFVGLDYPQDSAAVANRWVRWLFHEMRKPEGGPA